MTAKLTIDGTRIREVVFETVARHFKTPRNELGPSEELEVDPNGLVRILVDIEQQLGIGGLQGNWQFEDGSVNAIVDYYVHLLSPDSSESERERESRARYP